MEENSPKEFRVLLAMRQEPGSKELCAYLEHQGLSVLWARENQSAYNILDEEPVDGLICSLKDERIDGLRILKLALQRNSEICAIVITGPEEIELGTEAMRQGAYDFQVRPLNLAKIGAVLERGLSHQRLVGEMSALQRRLDERFRFRGISRRSSAWLRIYSQIERVAPSRASVLITGETGTGKSEVAKAIHQQSNRRENLFIDINCGALADSIVESELFGHEKGAFTGASRVRKGLFELADQGTLLLDEVGELSPQTQVKLLRVLQEGKVERVGGSKTYNVDVRIIAATNRDIEQMVEQGTFRQDLYYRLRVVGIEVPPLREAREDIAILVNAFIEQFAKENDKPLEGITPAALDVLMEYDWHGNVRELKNCIEGMVVMAPRGGLLEITDIPHNIRRRGRRLTVGSFQVGMSMVELEKLALQETLKAVDYDRRKAAQILQIGLSTLYRKEKEYGLVRGD